MHRLVLEWRWMPQLNIRYLPPQASNQVSGSLLVKCSCWLVHGGEKGLGGVRQPRKASKLLGAPIIGGSRGICPSKSGSSAFRLFSRLAVAEVRRLRTKMSNACRALLTARSCGDDRPVPTSSPLLEAFPGISYFRPVLRGCGNNSWENVKHYTSVD
jgi:hypothetical protein